MYLNNYVLLQPYNMKYGCPKSLVFILFCSTSVLYWLCMGHVGPCLLLISRLHAALFHSRLKVSSNPAENPTMQQLYVIRKVSQWMRKYNQMYSIGIVFLKKPLELRTLRKKVTLNLLAFSDYTVVELRVLFVWESIYVSPLSDITS